MSGIFRAAADTTSTDLVAAALVAGTPMTSERAATTADKRESQPAVPGPVEPQPGAAQPSTAAIIQDGAADARGGAEGEDSTTPMEETMAMLSKFGSAAVQRRVDLEERRREAAIKRKELTKEIRNEERKRQRVMHKARGLTETDLLELLGTKALGRAKAKSAAKAGAKAKAAPAPTSAATPP